MKNILALGIAVLLLILGGYAAYVTAIGNPRVVEELKNDPQGVRAGKVMLLTLPDGRELPVNYLREQNQVFVGADGPWWRELAEEGAEEGAEVTLLIRGEKLAGHARVELQDQSYIQEVFSRLRPTVPGWLPDWANGKLVVIELKPAHEDLPFSDPD